MHLFADYIQPLTSWIYNNPNWALFITFLISFAESLAIVGSIIPGSVTMTAIGILAGSGIMRIDLTLAAAALGAVAGDSLSYYIGYRFRNSLSLIWPFSRYPSWLQYGKAYFAKHGGKSVLIGRFIGPIRAVIPVIAGMLHMNRWHFFLANLTSAIGWTIIYVVPGILIGAASSELSAENASRLFLVIIGLLAATWIASLGLKWLVLRIHGYLHNKLNHLWLKLMHTPCLKKYINYLTPAHESQYYPTAGLMIIFLLSLFSAIVVCGLVIQEHWIAILNEPMHFFIQTLQTHYFDYFFVAVSMAYQPLTLMALYFSIVAYLMFHKDWRTLWYWVSLAITTGLTVYILNHYIPVPRPETALKIPRTLYFPSINLTFSTTLLSFLIFYISSRYRTTITLLIRVILVSLLLLEGIGSIYLANNWMTGVIGAYFIGLTLCVGHWIFYRKMEASRVRSQIPIVSSCAVLFVTSILSFILHFQEQVQVLRPPQKQYVLTESAWWNQEKPILPIYSRNRIGHRIGLFNIQFVGDIVQLESSLSKAGWSKQPTSFFFTLLEKIGRNSNKDNLPLKTHLHRNQRPMLVMTFKELDEQKILILRFWRSNYHIKDHNNPIWLGSIYPYFTKNKLNATTNYLLYPDDLFKPLRTALSSYKFKTFSLKNHNTRDLPNRVAPVVLLINNKISQLK